MGETARRVRFSGDDPGPCQLPQQKQQPSPKQQQPKQPPQQPSPKQQQAPRPARSPWSQPPQTFAQCNFRLAYNRRVPAPPNLPQGPWRPPSRQTELLRPPSRAAGSDSGAQCPPTSRPRPRPSPRSQTSLGGPTPAPVTKARPTDPALWAAGLTSAEVSGLGVGAGGVLDKSKRRATPKAAAVALRLSAQQKRERQARQVGRVLRDMIASRRSVSGKQMSGTIISAFEAIDRDGSGTVSTDEFIRAVERLGMGLTAKQQEQLIAVLDFDNDGCVSLPEFIALLTEPETPRQGATRSRHGKARKSQRKPKSARAAADAAAADALRCAANEVLLGRAAIEACDQRWAPSSALRAIDLADAGAGAALVAAVQ
jgi:hypothetical protein